MNLSLDKISTVDQMRAFVEGAALAEIVPLDRDGTYALIANALERVLYPRIGKADKGAVKRFLETATGLSRAPGHPPRPTPPPERGTRSAGRPPRLAPAPRPPVLPVSGTGRARPSDRGVWMEPAPPLSRPTRRTRAQPVSLPKRLPPGDPRPCCPPSPHTRLSIDS